MVCTDGLCDDSSWSQYVTFDAKHICEDSFKYIPYSKGTTGKNIFQIYQGQITQ